MPIIPLEQPKEPDIYTYQFDKNLNRAIPGTSSPLVYDTVEGLTQIRVLQSAGESIESVSRFEAYLSPAQTGVANATWTKVNFNIELYDARNEYDGNDFRFTALNSGRYYFATSVGLGFDSSLSVGQLALYVNGSATRWQTQVGAIAGTLTRSPLQLSLSGILDLDIKDYVEIFGYIDALNQTRSFTVDSTAVGHKF